MKSPRYYVKFTGKFKDLIPDGWTFQKLFANNYRQYSKTSDGKKYGPAFRVWQHLGGYIEYQDYFDDTWLIFNWVTTGNYLDCKIKRLYGDGYYFRGAINLKDHTIETLNYRKHDSAFVDLDSSLSEEQKQKLVEDIEDTYRKVIINQDEVNFILDLKKKGWFEIVKDERRH